MARALCATPRQASSGLVLRRAPTVSVCWCEPLRSDHRAPSAAHTDAAMVNGKCVWCKDKLCEL